MYNQKLVIEDLQNILWAIEQILKRFSVVKTSEDFLNSDAGLEKLDSICMQLINIGETLKHIDKLTDNKLLQQYSEIDWKKAKGMRDIITHHYFDIDAEMVYIVCNEHLPRMREIIESIVADLKNK